MRTKFLRTSALRPIILGLAIIVVTSSAQGKDPHSGCDPSLVVTQSEYENCFSKCLMDTPDCESYCGKDCITVWDRNYDGPDQ